MSTDFTFIDGLYCGVAASAIFICLYLIRFQESGNSRKYASSYTLCSFALSGLYCLNFLSFFSDNTIVLIYYAVIFLYFLFINVYVIQNGSSNALALYPAPVRMLPTIFCVICFIVHMTFAKIASAPFILLLCSSMNILICLICVLFRCNFNRKGKAFLWLRMSSGVLAFVLLLDMVDGGVVGDSAVMLYLKAAFLVDVALRLWLAQRHLFHFHRKYDKLFGQTQQLRDASQRDSMTGLFNRGYFDKKLNEAVERLTRDEQYHASLVLLDIDDFKAINDSYGHLAGDQVLHSLAEVMLQCTRQGRDVVCRYGGEEFAIILYAPLGIARRIAETTLQEFYAREHCFAGGCFEVSVSCGVAALHAGESSDDLVHRADRALYEAKRTGKNRVCIAPPAQEEGTLSLFACACDEGSLPRVSGTSDMPERRADARHCASAPCIAAVVGTEQAAPATASVGAEGHQTRQAVILLVEDDEINQEIARELLRAVNARVDTACNGLEAVRAACSVEYNLVIMDVQMPVMDGLEATRRIRAAGRGMPIIAMTAGALPEDRASGLAAGMTDYLVKPLDPAALYAALDRWLPVCRESRFRAGSPSLRLPRHLPTHIRGFNLAAGLATVGNNEVLYADLLAKFAARYGGIAEDISQSIADRNLEEAVRLAHTVKGIAANLGAEALAEAAGALEKTIMRDAVMTATRLQSLILCLEEAVGAVLGALQTAESTADSGPLTCLSSLLSVQQAEQLGHRVLAAVVQMERDWSAASEVALHACTVLESTSCAALARQLRCAVEDFETEEAVRLARTLRQSLSRARTEQTQDGHATAF